MNIPIYSWKSSARESFGVNTGEAQISLYLLLSNLLHRVIKGTFKDHFVSRVTNYLNLVQTPAAANGILDDIDRRIAATPQFPCVRRFKHGRRFKQWTGDDSKALMKIYLPAVQEFIPSEIVKAFGSFLDFCYLVRRPDFTELSLDEIETAIRRLHEHREIFRVTESRHITAVKKPWRRSSRSHASAQMLLTNQGLDSLAAARTDFVEREMIGAKRGYTTSLSALSAHIGVPEFPELVQRFLRDQLCPDSASESAASSDSGNRDIILVDPVLSVYHSAIDSPSDPSGIRGMRRERIRSTPRWRQSGRATTEGFRAISVVRVKLFFSFSHDGADYPCALVEWYKKIGRGPDQDTGMWMVEPELRHTREQKTVATVVHLDSLLRGAHLIPGPVYGARFLPSGFRHTQSLDAFEAFFVNKYIDIDAHANEIAY
ncbi:hypothetical protein C8R43DRAFT_1090218 [Mycena crocata]|nr:hypothetical protein C8R43DRAFT_1090218 [Mycena crocata]